jgi:cytochrome b561
MPQPNIERYDPKSQWLHWTTAALVALLWVLGQVIDLFPRGAPRVTVRSVHICVGIALAVVMIVRLRWRNDPLRVAPPAPVDRLGVIGAITHRVLYLLVAVVLVIGVLNAWERGDSLFGLVRFPSPAPDNRELREFIEELHEWASNTLLVVALLHAAAALFHHIVRRDDVLRRMLPPA